MKKTIKVTMFGWCYNYLFKKGMKYHGIIKETKDIKKEYNNIIKRAKEIGKSNLICSYCMGAYFIAVNKTLDYSCDKNYEIFKDGLYNNKLLRIILGNSTSYLDVKKMPKRKKWEKKSHLRKYENDWVVEVLPKIDEYDLGFNYHECGICKLCKDEGYKEIAKYLCKLDYVLADMMNIKLVRTQTIADGQKYCDFRYSKK